MTCYYMGFEPQEDMQRYEWGRWNAKLRALAIDQSFIVATESERNAILSMAPRLGVMVSTMKLVNGGYAIKRVLGRGEVRKVGKPKREVKHE